MYAGDATAAAAPAAGAAAKEGETAATSKAFIPYCNLTQVCGFPFGVSVDGRGGGNWREGSYVI